MQKTEYDFLILGQGLAGSILAWQLIKAGKTALVIDDDLKTSSSKVAAGMINPAAGIRLNHSPRTAEWLEAAHAFYDDVGLQTDQHYFHDIPMQRVFQSEKQKSYYDIQLNKIKPHPYLGKILDKEEIETSLLAPHGALIQKQTGYVDIPLLLQDLKEWLIEQDAYQQQSINHQDIQSEASRIIFKTYSAKHLIFCEGYKMIENPWFKNLKLQPDKGEMLRLRSKRTLCKQIANNTQWLIPLQGGDYRLGATHEHKQIDNEATVEAKAFLIKSLKGLVGETDDIEVVEHNAGVRSATQDRHPLLGTHPKQANLHLFNGFGARGALTIPWYAKTYCDFLLQQTAIPKEANIERYKNWNTL